MSKIPIDRNGKLRIRGIYSMKSIDVINPSKDKHADTAAAKNIDAGTTADNKELFCSNYLNLVPKMSLSLDKGLEKNPRILDLREKLNEITKKQDRNVDKETKGLINGITQLVEEKEQDESGPYSLLFDLQPATSTYKESIERDLLHTQSLKNSMISINKSAERLPNVINFDEKPLREFEYSCENQINFPVTKTFNTHSRSDLCLQLKSQINPRIYDTNLSPNDNSLNRTNEENSLDDSLGILTPDQMDDICYLENAFSPTVEGLPIFCDNNESKVSPDCSDTPSTDKTESNSAVSTIQNDEFERNDCTAPLTRNIESIKSDKLSKSCDNLTAQNTSSVTAIIADNSVTSTTKDNKMDQIDAAKDELIPNVIDEEFMPSIHSSILEPVSSIAETTVNLELPLDCKLENRLVVQRIEQTPSPEDLPLDSSDINGEISTYSQFSNSTLHDSQTYSDNKNDYPKSMETSKVSNSFITSITSITSLDGYQGDGEMSRPVSRAADHSMEPREDVIEMEWQNVPVTRRADPMTDSDFFTESDADGLDDHMHRGDRKAQVIDGALYGGKNSNGNPPLIVNRNDDSCMESSGVYTDFENHRQSPVFLNVIDDMSPEGSTPSTHSELSQKNVGSGQVNTYFTPLEECMNEESFNKTLVVEEDKTPKNTSKRNSLNSEKDVRSNAKSKDEKRSFTLKKYKMPKRDVPSKLKTMLASRSTDADNSVQSSPKTVKKIDRRESLTKKNSLDIKTDYKMKSFKDIKSKVDCSFSLQRSQTACSVSRMLSSKSTNTNLKPKSRHMRMRMELGSAAGSGKSSLHSSQSDISATSTPLGKQASRFPLLMDEAQAVERLKEVLQRASQYGLDVNWKKSQLVQRRVEYLGHVVENGTVRPSPDKTDAVVRFPQPTNVKQLHGFVGLTSYFRKFIQNYALIARPLTELLKKDADFIFEEPQKAAFNELKMKLASMPVLRIFNPALQTELHSDASKLALACILLQRCPEDGQLHPVYYMSKKTSDAEKKYSSYELEALAIIEGVKKFRQYLYGIKFKIVTDCQAFELTLRKKDLSTRVARWALILQEYDYVVEHRTGSQMRHVDALSRSPYVGLVTRELHERVREAQEQDGGLVAIREILEEKPYLDYSIENNVLYRGLKLVVPSGMELDIIKRVHERGHFGKKKMLEMLDKDYHINDLSRKIDDFIVTCVPCLLATKKSGKQEGFLHCIDKGSIPLHTIHCDHVGPLTETKKQYNYILTVVDAFTKFVWVYPTKSTTTKETLDKLRLHQQIFGNPVRMITDRGAAFTSNDFKEYCNTENIQHVLITTGVPRGNGQVERIHRIIISVLTKLCISEPGQWYRHVARVQTALNSTYQRSIDTTPFELLVGTKMRSKDDVQVVELLQQECYDSFVEEREQLRQSAQKQILKIQQENRSTYNKKRKESTLYQIGDKVAILRTQYGTCLKLKPRFFGPYRVTAIRGQDRYDVEKIESTAEGPARTSTSADNMKPWPRGQ